MKTRPLTRRGIAGALALLVTAIVPTPIGHAAPSGPGTFSCPVAVRFSPHGGAEGAIVATLRRARTRVHAAVYGLTSPRIEAALKDLAGAGVRVVLKTDRSQSTGKEQFALLARLHAAGVTIDISRSRRLLHDKFAVVDDRWVISGSFNWTTSAELRNRENLLIFDCPALAGAFEAEWERIT